MFNSKWDIHFENIVPKEGSVSIGTGDSAAVINPNDNTEVTYEVTLDNNNEKFVVSGRELKYEGITVYVPASLSSELVLYKSL